MCPLTSVTFGTSSYAPSGLIRDYSHPGLTAWAAIWRRFAAVPVPSDAAQRLSVAVGHLCSVGLCSADYLYSICCAQQDTAGSHLESIPASGIISFHPSSGASMKRSAAVFVTVLLLGTLCCAQESSPSGQDSGQSVASAAKVSRAKIDLKQAKEAHIRQLLDLTHAGALATQTMDSMEGNIKPLMTNSFPPGEY